MSDDALASPPVDLSNCDREPIHIPGAIQPHGVLFVLREPDWEILQISENIGSVAGRTADQLLGRRLETLIGAQQAEALGRLARRSQHNDPFPLDDLLTLGQPPRDWAATVYRGVGGLILELEPTVPAAAGRQAYHLLDSLLTRFQAARGAAQLCQLVAAEVRRISGFDRVMIYRFEEDWHGSVVAEDRREHMASYLGLRFPASDIPAQARELYQLNRIRVIADADYQPVPLAPVNNPATGEPTDLSFSVLRSVSPIHVEYLQNMGVKASMSVSIVQDGKLWGLIACHHATPRIVPYQERTACGVVGQLVAVLLSSQQELETKQVLERSRHLQAKLLESMFRADTFVEGLTGADANLVELVGASGAAIHTGEECLCFGQAPPQEFIADLVRWLDEDSQREQFATHALLQVYPEAEAFRESCSGLLAVSLSRLKRYYLLWFRPEVLTTVRWAGDPGRAAVQDSDGEMRMHPRKSFEAWKETKRGQSVPWKRHELGAARELRSSIMDVVFVKTEQWKRLHASLEEANAELRERNRELQDFTYVASHDLKSPLVTIKGFLGMLQQDLRKGNEDALQSDITRIADATDRMKDLLDGLLELSRIGRIVNPYSDLPIDNLLREAMEALSVPLSKAGVQVEVVADLPVVRGDRIRLLQVVQNLLENSVKFMGDQPQPRIEIGSRKEADETVITFRDNGIGIEAAFQEKVFSLFHKLDAKGTGSGIGLALVRRIVEAHGGRAWAESEGLGQGTTICFTIPRRGAEASESGGAQ